MVAFNYRHSVHAMQLKELLAQERVGKITSVDFNWYLNVYHGADYFRRWHGRMAKSGSLWVHKATHHFDLLNWWLNSEPVEVSAYGKLEHYGKNNSFRGTTCRGCTYKDRCKFFWDITKDQRLTDLYVKMNNTMVMYGMVVYGVLKLISTIRCRHKSFLPMVSLQIIP